MPGGNVRDLRRRVRSVKNIQQITRAMKFVAASKLRRAQERIFAVRPYANRMLAVLNSLASRVDSERHPLLMERRGDKAMLVVVTADRGLCGAFNANIVKASMKRIESEEVNRSISLTLVGKKGADWYRKRSWTVKHEYLNIMSKVDFKYAHEIEDAVTQYYLDGEVDTVYLVYNEFKSVVQQRVIVETLLPVKRLEKEDESSVTRDYIYEQPPEIILDHLLPRHIETQLFRALLESEASEHGARMTAMDAATRNASEMIETLTLTMNRMRQASITTEIIEIVSGANALQAE